MCKVCYHVICLFNIPKCDTALVVKSLMERQYRECDNQSHITLECDTAFQPIRTQESGYVIKVNNINQSCVF